MTANNASWQPSEAHIIELERAGKPVIYREAAVPKYQLPDLLRATDGTRITTQRAWEQRIRPATLDAFESCVYGRSPTSPAGIGFERISEDQNALKGKATEHRGRIIIPTANQPFTFEATVLVPNQPISPRVAAFLLLDHRQINPSDPGEFWPAERMIDRGYAAAIVHLPEIQPDNPVGLTDGVISAIPQHNIVQAERWATIAAWAWGTSRTMDWLCTIHEIDSARVAVIGHSRGGKAALWAGAQDTRFAMVISNESGCGGAALSRRHFGETIAFINGMFPHWFCENFKRFNDRENDLLIDQHQLLALIAPRPLYIGCADQDLWGDPRGSFLALTEASAVYELTGGARVHPDEMPALDMPLVRGPLGFHIRSGSHRLARYDWDQYLAFADVQLTL